MQFDIMCTYSSYMHRAGVSFVLALPLKILYPQYNYSEFIARR